MAPCGSRSNSGRKVAFRARRAKVRRVLAATGFALTAEAATGVEAEAQIKHVIIIMQENRSFDHYFGTFPGANGIPPGTCVPLDPAKPGSKCVEPFHDKRDSNGGGPHQSKDATADLDDGITKAKLDGFVASQTKGGRVFYSECAAGTYPADSCYPLLASFKHHEVMGYHTDKEIPNYWAYAKSFVLQDAMFSGERSWSVPQHLDLTSEWSASCTNGADASTCQSDIGDYVQANSYPWVTLFQLLDKYSVSWKYYLGEGMEPDCEAGEVMCPPVGQGPLVPSIFNPTPSYAYVKRMGSTYLAQHVQDTAFFCRCAKSTVAFGVLDHPVLRIQRTSDLGTYAGHGLRDRVG